MLPTLFMITVVGIIVLAGYKMMIKKKTPSNRYTPYDDMVMGRKDEGKREQRVQNPKQEDERNVQCFYSFFFFKKY
ncbi:DUF3951 domain-containing protein [Peribacillus muralis]|uniref:DUF3951 domain-containing protein n=1 Tax=Peribacillus muralis TaxID=264697 RepID=UPI003D0142F3